MNERMRLFVWMLQLVMIFAKILDFRYLRMLYLYMNNLKNRCEMVSVSAILYCDVWLLLVPLLCIIKK